MAETIAVGRHAIYSTARQFPFAHAARLLRTSLDPFRGAVSGDDGGRARAGTPAAVQPGSKQPAHRVGSRGNSHAAHEPRGRPYDLRTAAHSEPEGSARPR